MKKRLLSLLMALVLTLGLTGTGFATDEPALAGYTKENSFHAVKDFYESTYPARYGPSSRNSDPQPRDPELLAAYESGQRQLPTGFQSPFGTLRETWGYLAEHCTFDIADGWLEENFSSPSQDGGAAFLNYVARGDFDRHFAYILAVYGPTSAKTFCAGQNYRYCYTTDETLLKSLQDQLPLSYYEAAQRPGAAVLRDYYKAKLGDYQPGDLPEPPGMTQEMWSPLFYSEARSEVAKRNHFVPVHGSPQETWIYLFDLYGRAVADQWLIFAHTVDPTGGEGIFDEVQKDFLAYLDQGLEADFQTVLLELGAQQAEAFVNNLAALGEQTDMKSDMLEAASRLLNWKTPPVMDSALEKTEAAQALWTKCMEEDRNNRYYLQVLQHNREKVAAGIDPATYQNTLVTPAVQQKSDELCAGAQGDRDKVARIHDWVAEHIARNGENLKDMVPAQTVLERGYGGLQQYAILTQALLWAQKIPCVYVEGTTTYSPMGSGNNWSGGTITDSWPFKHAWNMVLLDGEWLGLDVSWDSQTLYRGGNDSMEPCTRTYFLAPMEIMSLDHRIREIGMTIEGVNLAATVTPDRTPDQVGADPTLSAWAKGDVLAAMEGNIAPQILLRDFTNDITRAEFCLLLDQMTQSRKGMDLAQYAKGTGVEVVTGAFGDVPKEHPQAQCIYAAIALKITYGTGDTTFSPNGSLTRQEAATLLYRWAGVMELPLTPGGVDAFSDGDKIAFWAAEAVGALVASGVMTGTDQGFAPKLHYTREQAIITALRICKIA